jgi:hypothetical protein
VAINPAEQIAGHPPLYYGLASLLLALTEQPHHPISPEHNLVLNVPLLGTTKENKNQFIHPPGELLDPGTRPTYLLRLFSLILGIGAIVGGFGIARTMGLSGALSLAAAAGIAVTPQFIFIAGSISNDALTATLSALSLWMLLAALDKDRWWRWMLASILIGLTALTKTSGLALAGVGVAATLTAFWRDRAVGRGILRFAAVASVPLLMVGWWYLRNAFLFHDPLATQIHHLKMAREAPLAALQIIQQWPIIERSFWAAFGWGNILYDDAFYLSFRLAEIIALAGLMLLVLKREALARRAGFWLLLLFIGALVFSLGLWTRSLWGSWGRLLFPGISAIMVMMMIGLRRIHRLTIVIFLLWLGGVAIASPFMFAQAYHPATYASQEEIAQTVQTLDSPATFGDIARLTATDIRPDRVRPGEHTHVSLCWEVLSQSRIPYITFIQIIGPDNAPYGFRFSHPGRGNAPTTSWQPGSLICDDFLMFVDDKALGPAVYPVDVWMYNFDEEKRLPVTVNDVTTDHFTIGHIKLYGDEAVQVPDTGPAYPFADNVTLLAYEWTDVRPGEELPVTLYWQARGPISYPYTVFIHLLDDRGQIVAQIDAQPRTPLGDYPMTWWDTDEIVRDEHIFSITSDLSPGTYTLEIGLSNAETLAQLPLLDGGESAHPGAITIH